jgi:hypothetical protein
MLSLLTNNEKVKDPEPVASDFSNFFLTITESLNLPQVGREDAISFLKDAFPVKFPGIKIIPTTETEIKCIIHSLIPKTHQAMIDSIIYLLYVMGGFICNTSLLYVNPLFILCEIYIIV